MRVRRASQMLDMRSGRREFLLNDQFIMTTKSSYRRYIPVALVAFLFVLFIFSWRHFTLQGRNPQFHLIKNPFPGLSRITEAPRGASNVTKPYIGPATW